MRIIYRPSQGPFCKIRITMKFKKVLCAVSALLLVTAMLPFSAYAVNESYKNSFSEENSANDLEISKNGKAYISAQKLVLEGDHEYPPLTSVLFPFDCEDDFSFSFTVSVPDGSSDNGWCTAVFGQKDASDHKLTFEKNKENIDVALSYCAEEGSFEKLADATFPLADVIDVNITVNGMIACVSINEEPALMCVLQHSASGKCGFGAKGGTALFDDVEIKNGKFEAKKASSEYEKELYIPKSGIASMPAVVQFDDQNAKEYSSDKKREAVSIYDVHLEEGKLCVYSKGKNIGTLEERMALKGNFTVPAFYVSDSVCANALGEWIKEKKIKDATVISKTPEFIKIAKGENNFVRGIVDNSDSITVNIKELCKKAIEADCNTVMLSQRSATAKNVRMLKSVFVNVYALCEGDKDSDIYACLSSGCDGIVGNADKIITYAEKISDKAFFGYSPIISDGGDTSTAPANTMTAILKAASNGADIVQTDVCITSDGCAVLYDSDTTELLTETVSIYSTSVGELNKLTYKDERVNEGIPTLSDVLKAVRISYPELVIHVRLSDDRKLTAQAVNKAAVDNGMQDRVVILTQSETVDGYVKQKLEVGVNCVKDIILPSTLTNNEKIYYIEAALNDLNSAYRQIEELDAEFLYYAFARGVTVVSDSVREIASINCEREPSGKIKVSGVSSDGSVSVLTQKAELVPISGDIKLESGYVTGSGVFAVRVPLADGVYLYSKSISVDEAQKNNGDVTLPDDEEDTEIIKYVVFGSCGVMVIGGLVFFGVLKKRAFKAKKK